MKKRFLSLIRAFSSFFSPIFLIVIARVMNVLAHITTAVGLKFLNNWTNETFVSFTTLARLHEFVELYKERFKDEDNNILEALDRRELENHKPNRQLAGLLLFLSAAAYESEAKAIKLINEGLLHNSENAEEIKLINETTDAQVLKVKFNKRHLVFAFRGTEASLGGDWLTDFHFSAGQRSVHPFTLTGEQPHQGFASYLWGDGNAYAVIKQEIQDAIKVRNLELQLEHHGGEKPELCIHICGHSLGAALASLFVAGLVRDQDFFDTFEAERVVLNLYSFSKPTEGNMVLTINMTEQFRQEKITHFYYGHGDDLVYNIHNRFLRQNFFLYISIFPIIPICTFWSQIGLFQTNKEDAECRRFEVNHEVDMYWGLANAVLPHLTTHAPIHLLDYFFFQPTGETE